jgi:hypothetical protein
MGLWLAFNRRLPPSSRHYGSRALQGLYKLEVEVVWILRGAKGIFEMYNIGKAMACKRDSIDVPVEYGLIFPIGIFACAQSPGARQPVSGSFRGLRTV